MKSNILIFPGQGGQKFGEMTKFTLKNKILQNHLFKLSERYYGRDLVRTMQFGPQSKLVKTSYLQPAIFLASLFSYFHWMESVSYPLSTIELNDYYCQPKILNILKKVLSTGFSIGEITALAASNSITLDEGFSIIKARAEAMQYASDMIPSKMYIVNGLTRNELMELGDKLISICNSGPKRNSSIFEISMSIVDNLSYTVSLTNDLNSAFIDEIDKISKAKAMRLEVSGGFHSRCMEPAYEMYFKHVNNMKFNEPFFDILSNFSAEKFTSKNISNWIIDQIKSPIKWNIILSHLESVSIKNENNYANGDQIIEFSAGGAQVFGVVKKYYPDLARFYQVYYSY